MKAKEFGNHITVYVDEPNFLNDHKQVVEINWYALGSVSAEQAEQFCKELKLATEYAKSVEAESVVLK